jgi:multidrug transporter EmrE-like cation transporter
MSHYLAMAIAILLTSFAQVLLKSGVTGKESWHRGLLSWRTVIANSMFVIVTILNVYAMQAIDLKIVSAWVSVTYVLVILLSWKVLKEKLDHIIAIGCVLIVSGIIIFNSPTFR